MASMSNGVKFRREAKPTNLQRIREEDHRAKFTVSMLVLTLILAFADSAMAVDSGLIEPPAVHRRL